MVYDLELFLISMIDFTGIVCQELTYIELIGKLALLWHLQFTQGGWYLLWQSSRGTCKIPGKSNGGKLFDFQN